MIADQDFSTAASLSVADTGADAPVAKARSPRKPRSTEPRASSPKAEAGAAPTAAPAKKAAGSDAVKNDAAPAASGQRGRSRKRPTADESATSGAAEAPAKSTARTAPKPAPKAAPKPAAASGEAVAAAPKQSRRNAGARGKNTSREAGGKPVTEQNAELAGTTNAELSAGSESRNEQRNEQPNEQRSARPPRARAKATADTFAAVPPATDRAAAKASAGAGAVESADVRMTADAEDGDDAPRKKSRRGRRGGRGRNRKNKQPVSGEISAQDAAPGNGPADVVDTDLAGTATDATHTSPDFLAPHDADEPAAVSTADTSAAVGDDADDGDNIGNTAADKAASGRSQPAARQARGRGDSADGKKKSSTRDSRSPRSNEAGKKTGTAIAAASTVDSKAETAAAPGNGKRRMFISVLPGEQVEVAVAEEGVVLEYYLDMLHQRKIKGNIYKGIIHNIDTNLQAAFVSYGSGKNGFLQIDEVHSEYWLTPHEPAKGKKFPPIQKVLKAGQEVLVQVVKEPTGNKGAFLTTWLSLAGRFLVLTPGQEQIGVSRKVEDDEERARLREMMNGIEPGKDLGVIVRTVSAGTTKTTLKNDLQYLKRVWRDIRKKAGEVSAPSLIYQEPGLSERAVRDYLTEDVCEIWVDNEDVSQDIRDTVSLLFPRKRDLVRLHGDVRQPMWERFNLRRQLDQIYSREVQLPSGGRLVFDQTEALMAVDINSGKISGKGNFEAMAHKTNMEAAETIARQLRLRDVGGQVVIDFIEMRDKKHVLEVEKTLRQAMKNDRARHDVARMSSFGLLELVRQRTGSSALAITMEPCPTCGGTGQRRNMEWQALQSLRELRRMLRAGSGDKCTLEVGTELGLYLLNHKRDSLREMEQDYGKCVEISIRP